MNGNKTVSTRFIRKTPLGKQGALARSRADGPMHRAPLLWMTTSSARQAAKLTRRDGLVLQHFRLVKAIAVSVHEKLPVHVELANLVQSGVNGLLDAATKFEADAQVDFSLYAKHRIKGAILDGLQQLDCASPNISENQCTGWQS
jgi:DNA-directed RNA polymerase specialized sigma subunit